MRPMDGGTTYARVPPGYGACPESLDLDLSIFGVPL